jgi:hypothetical protein
VLLSLPQDAACVVVVSDTAAGEDSLSRTIDVAPVTHPSCRLKNPYR